MCEPRGDVNPLSLIEILAHSHTFTHLKRTCNMVSIRICAHNAHAHAHTDKYAHACAYTYTTCRARNHHTLTRTLSLSLFLSLSDISTATAGHPDSDDEEENAEKEGAPGSTSPSPGRYISHVCMSMVAGPFICCVRDWHRYALCMHILFSKTKISDAQYAAYEMGTGMPYVCTYVRVGPYTRALHVPYMCATRRIGVCARLECASVRVPQECRPYLFVYQDAFCVRLARP